MPLPIEIWRPVADFPDYAVSNLGRVRRVSLGRGTNAIGGILKQGVSEKGYLRVYLSRYSKKHTIAVHRLVAKEFIPNPLNLPQVNHVDTNKQNCRVDNLEWADQVRNMQHASAHSLIHGDGVYFYPQIGKFRATYCPQPRNRVVLGDFILEQDAINARNAAIKSMEVA